jgi:hypothetical protein
MVLQYEDNESKRQQSSRRAKNSSGSVKVKSDRNLVVPIPKAEAKHGPKPKKTNPTIKVTQQLK